MATEETKHIAGQLRRIYGGPSWLGPSTKDLLDDVTPEQAARRPINNAHTIWEITLHMASWLNIARRRLSDASAKAVSDAEDWPAVSGTWPEAMQLLDDQVTDLERAIRDFPDERLHEDAPADEPQTFYMLFHGVIQHTAYHSGQIALLKK